VPTTQPVISGVTKVGSKLTVKGGTWTVKPKSLTYTWLSCNANGRSCTTIAGATTATYTPVAADATHTLVGQVLAISGTAKAAVLSLASTAVSP
ncbi:MAG TPA: hypothetical protein VJP39_07150, partial [Gaiellaceae bacterium]|nr:hypothetical protein [Gaiellaceae bacterium]